MKHQTQSDIAYKLGEVKVEPKKIDYWVRRKQAMEHAQMDNQSMVGYETHESY